MSTSLSDFKLITRNNISYLSSSSFEPFSFLKHAFSLKLDGCLQPGNHFQDLEGCHEDTIPEEAFLKTLGIPKECLITLKQVHENQCKTVFRNQAIRVNGSEGDSLITSDDGIALGVRAADCFPVLMLDHEKKVISCTHAGWRGLSKRILETCIALMIKDFSCRPESISVAIGPGIGKCCYIVQEDVIKDFEKNQTSIQPFLSQAKPPSFTLDLKGIITDQLIGKGLSRNQIHHAPFCTSCSGLPFSSYRREGKNAGRALSVIMLIENEKP